jgi:hypothetical protein
VTTGGLSSFGTDGTNHLEGTETEVGQATMFGAIHSHVSLTTFSTVSLSLFSFPSLLFVLYLLSSLTVTPSL